MMEPPRRLVAVVVTHNRLSHLKATLARLLEAPPEHLSAIIVVDTASSDGTTEWLAQQADPRLESLRSDINIGGAGGFERGMRYAMDYFDPDWLVLMDDDARPEPGAIATFLTVPQDRWDAIAAAVYFPNGEICEMNRPSRNPFWHRREFLKTLFFGGRSGFHIRHGDYTGPGIQIDVTSFVGFFISRRAVMQAGYPDPQLFLYGDDGIYSLGLSKSGLRIGFEPEIRFEHDLSTFVGQRGRFRPLWKAYYYHRNLLLLYRLAAGWLFWPACLMILPKWLLKIRHHKGQRAACLALMRRAIRDGLRGRLDTSHAQVLALAGGRPMSSVSRGDTAPEEETPSTRPPG